MQVDDFLQCKWHYIFEDHSITKIQAALQNGSVDLIDPDPYFTLIGDLPNNGQRLSWEKIDHVALFPPSGVDGSTASLKNVAYAQQVERFLHDVAVQYELSKQRCVLFEDHWAGCGLAMGFDLLETLVEDLVYSPFHKYVLAIDNDWLLNFTMEGVIYFCPSPPSKN